VEVFERLAPTPANLRLLELAPHPDAQVFTSCADDRGQVTPCAGPPAR
jgi:hypothetical protein